jgi:hypothetical protein
LVKSRDAGFDAHLPKPLDFTRLTTTILRLASKTTPPSQGPSTS